VSQTILRDLMSSHGSGTLQPLAVGWGPRAPGRQRRWSDLWSTSFLSGLGSLADLVCLPGSPLMTGPNLGDAFQVGDLTALLDRDFSGGGGGACCSYCDSEATWRCYDGIISYYVLGYVLGSLHKWERHITSRYELIFTVEQQIGMSQR
jgi:hypothetical protein